WSASRRGWPGGDAVDVFSLRDHLVTEYSSFARSFTKIAAGDLRKGVNNAYASGRYWPDPLIQINPRYQLGRSVEELAAEGELHPLTAKMFPIDLYRHQEQAIAFGGRGESFV